MKNKQAFRLVLLSLVAILGLDCKKQDTTQVPQRKEQISAFAWDDTLAPNNALFTFFYEGSLNNKDSVYLQLHGFRDSVAGNLRLNTSENKFFVKGSFSHNYEDTLAVGEKVQLTGFFHLMEDLSGTWIDSTGTSNPIQLRLLKQSWYYKTPFIKGGRLVISRKEYNAKSKEGDCTAKYVFPIVIGLRNQDALEQINLILAPGHENIAQEIADSCGREIGASKDIEGPQGYSETTFRFVGICHSILCLSKNYAEYQGGAHGLYGSQSMLLDMNTGKKVSSADIFSPGYEQTLNRLIRQKIERSSEKDLYDFTSIQAEPNIEIYPDSLVTVFNPYEIAPYSMGQVRFAFTYAELTPALRPDGPLGMMRKVK